jgi:bla regulator protein BlaR1
MSAIERISSWVWEASWQAALIAAVVFLAQWLLRTRLSAGWRHALWFLVVARLVMPVLPQSPASVYNFAPRVDWAPEISEQTAVAKPIPVAVEVSVVEGSPVTSPVAKLQWSQLISILSAIWAAGAIVLGLRLVFGTQIFMRRARRLSCAAPPTLRRLLEEAVEMSGTRRPLLMETAAVITPTLAGISSPRILLPQGIAERLSESELRHVLLHELAHVKRRDVAVNWLVNALLAVHWFNPVLWLAFRQMRADREIACDELALRAMRGDERKAYGETLIKVSDGIPAAGAWMGMVGIFESRDQLEKRIRAIVTGRNVPRHATMLAIAMIGIVAVAALTGAERDKTPKTTAETTADTNVSVDDGSALSLSTVSTAPPESKWVAVGSKGKALSGGSYRERILAAARVGDGKGIGTIIIESYKAPVGIGEEGATQMIDSLVASRELGPFTVLLDQMMQTNLGKNWQVNDELLAGLVKDGRTDFLEVLLARKLDPERLRTASAAGNAETKSWIAKRTSEVEAERKGIDDLIEACAQGKVEDARKLLDAGVNVNGRTSKEDSWTPLTRASAADKPEVVKLLLERGADPNIAKHPGWDYTPLCLAESVEVCQMLKDGGANVHATLFKRDTSILTYVAMFNGAKVVQWFLDQGLDPKMIGDNDQTLLFEVKDAETAEILLKAGVDPNRPDEFGNVPLQNARNGEVVRALIKGGAKLTGFKLPLIPGMIQMSQGDAVKAVLESGVKIDPKDLQKALITAAHMDRDESAKALIEAGANPNEPSEWSGPNDTIMPLQVCCIFGSEKTAKVLLEKGADPNGGQYPGMYLRTAIQNREKEVVELLQKAGAKGASELTLAIATGDKAKTGELLSKAPEYADDANFWDGVLITAARQGDIGTVEKALSLGVPPISKEKGKLRADDAYAAASFEGQDEVLEYLLSKRKSKNAEEIGKALSDAVWNGHPYNDQRSAEHFEKCVKLLLDAGASFKKPGSLMQTAILTRNPGGNPKIMTMLAEAGVDPDPEINKGLKLSKALNQICTTPNCSVPSEVVLETYEKLANVKIERLQAK